MAPKCTPPPGPTPGGTKCRVGSEYLNGKIDRCAGIAKQMPPPNLWVLPASPRSLKGLVSVVGLIGVPALPLHAPQETVPAQGGQVRLEDHRRDPHLWGGCTPVLPGAIDAGVDGREPIGPPAIPNPRFRTMGQVAG